jgi:hypothetical protein
VAINASQHFITIDEIDETDEGGLHQYRWVCSCRSEGRWAEDKADAERNGQAHARRKSPRRPRENNATRLLRRGGLTLNI